MLKTSVLLVLTAVLLVLATATAQAQRLAVKVPIANIRAAPTTDAAVIWQVEKFHPLTIIEKKADWCQFEDFEGDRGWIHSSLLADIRSVVVKKENCNVRSGPGTENDILFTVEKGVPFRVLETRGQWVHVIHEDGDQGWIHESLVW